MKENGVLEQSNEVMVTALATPLLLNGCFITDIRSIVALREANVVFSTVRRFPRNIDFTVQYLVALSPDRNLDLSLRFGISKLPDEPMPSRRADYRVGYFTSSFTDIGNLVSEANKQVNDTKSSTDSKLHLRESAYIDPTVHIIQRRRMSRDGGGLIYYVDPSVPKKWRKAVKRGVENWQPAFESAMVGSEAIRAVLPGDVDWRMDYDPADIRFNAITWAVDTDSTFAIGPSTVDPRSGEILRSSIVVTNGFIRSYIKMAEEFSSLGEDRRNMKLWSSREENDVYYNPQNSLLNDPTPKRFRNLYDDLLASTTDHSRVASQQIPDDVLSVLPSLIVNVLSQSSERKAASNSPNRYSIRHGHTSPDVGFLENRGLYSGVIPAHILSDEVISQGISAVIMHEVGHTLGLRHNFRGSTVYNLTDLQDPEFTAKHGLSSSVMDYIPLNIVSKRLRGERSAKPDIFTTRIGVYDEWAIKYGYMPLDDSKSGQNEPLLFLHPRLEEVAAACEPYSTDEDNALADGIDPFINMYDLGNDPLGFYIDRLDLIKEMREDGLLERAVGPTEPFTFYGNFEEKLVEKMKRIGLYMAKYVGGFNLRKVSRETSEKKDHLGKNVVVVPLQPIAVDVQLKALSAIKRLLVYFNDEGLWPAPSLLPYMVKSSGYCSGSFPFCDGTLPYPFLTAVSKMRKEVLLSLVSPERLERLQLQYWGAEGIMSNDNNSMSTFGPADLFNNITAMLWGEELLRDGAADSMK